MIMFVVHIIQRIREQRMIRLRTIQNTRTIRSDKEGFFEDNNSITKICLAMDNYFILVTVVENLKEMCIEVVGTAWFRRNWLPVKLRNMTISDINFNDLCTVFMTVLYVLDGWTMVWYFVSVYFVELEKL